MRDRVLDYEEAVLKIVCLIPAGKVLTYGDIAEILERGGPRQVGSVLSRASSDAPWWRVLRADGRPPQGLEAEAVEHYRAESTALKAPVARGRLSGIPAGSRVELAESRWNPTRAEQDALQGIRALLAAGATDCAGLLPRLSDADDGVDS